MTSDSLIIGFDLALNGDAAALAVIRNNGMQAKVLNVFTGDEAKEVYTKLTGIKLEEGTGVVATSRETASLLTWNHDPNSPIIGKVEKVEDIDDAVIATVHKDSGYDDFCNNIDKAIDEEIRKEYFSGMRTTDDICDLWNITKEDLGVILSNEDRN